MSAGLQERLEAALNKFTKWRAVLAGWQMGSASIENETCRAIRDHRELSMLMRAEISAQTQLLVAKGHFTLAEFQAQLLKEVEHLDKAYERKFPGFRSRHDGIEIYSVQLAADTTRHWKP